MSSPEHKQKIWKLIQDIRVGMLVSDDGGDLNARPMTLVQDDYDGTLWFFTGKDSEKVDEIKKDKDVCLTFADKDDSTYVSLSGKARLSQDKALIEKFWNPFVAAWFPDGKSDPNVALLEIKINKGEHWKTDKNGLLQLVEMAKANFTDEKPDLGENEEFG